MKGWWPPQNERGGKLKSKKVKERTERKRRKTNKKTIRV